MMSIEVVPEPIAQALLLFGSTASLVWVCHRGWRRFEEWETVLRLVKAQSFLPSVMPV